MPFSQRHARQMPGKHQCLCFLRKVQLQDCETVRTAMQWMKLQLTVSEWNCNLLPMLVFPSESALQDSDWTTELKLKWLCNDWQYRMCNDCSSCLNACEKVQCRAAGAAGNLAEYVLRFDWCSSWIGATARSNCNTFQRLQDLCLQSFQAMRHAMLLLLDKVAHYGIVAKQRKI